MLVTVRLHTILQRQVEGGERRMEIELADGATVGELVELLGIQISPEMLLFAVNGRTAELEHALQDGDKVNLMAAISGG